MRLRSRIILAFATLVVAAALLEGYLWLRFYQNVDAARETLSSLKTDISLASLTKPTAEVVQVKARLAAAEGKLASAERHTSRDPLLFLARRLPWLDRQALGLDVLTEAGLEGTRTGVAAAGVLESYSRLQNDPGLTAVQEGIGFLESQASVMAEVRGGLERMRAAGSRTPAGLLGPLDRASADLRDAIDKLDELVTGFERARALLPPVLGFNGATRFLVLAQNDTELFPSGGLISNYGMATFDRGRIASLEFEYFTNLYNRWQRASGREYVEPPEPLKNYLLRQTSWALGEAGWYPDFPTTARLAQSFVEKGGAAPADGTIALDLQFVAELLRLLGPMTVKEYGIVVNADNLSEVALQQTRDDPSLPDSPGKSFLSALAKDMLDRVFGSTKDDWPRLLSLLDRMARERHLQLYFNDARLQEMAAGYDVDGSIEAGLAGDFLLLADTSVHSTKLNLILRPQVEVQAKVLLDGSAEMKVTYEVSNPFRSWQQGRDPALVSALMLEGVYGSYLRLYAPPQAQLMDLRIDGQTVGPEQIDTELGKRAFGRYFTVNPDQTVAVEFAYRVPAVVRRAEDGSLAYRLYLQKQPGTRAIPVSLSLALPGGFQRTSATVDGVGQDGATLTTDLRTDRIVEVLFKPE